jgi:hypothetical protein
VKELEQYEILSDKVAEDVNEEIRLNGNLTELGKNYTTQEVDSMALNSASSICPRNIDHYDVADLAKDKIDYNYCGD